MMKFVLPVVFLLSMVNLAQAEKIESKLLNFMHELEKQETLTNGFFGLNEELDDYGIELGLGVTRLYQHNAHGGMSTHREAGRHSGSYDFEITTDLHKLYGIKGARLYVHAEGLWSKSQSIDSPSVGSAFGVNADGGPRRSIDVTELWYEQSLLDGAFILRFGKMDLTGGFEHSGCPVSFDCGFYANDEASQFLNGAFVNNPTIPFPDYALGLAGLYSPVDWWYASAGVVDAQNDFRETGFSTTFHDEDYFFYVLETGITPRLDSVNGPLAGAYRVGLWNDPQPKAHSDAVRNYRDDVGFYITCDQMLTKENAEPNDTQGLGVFARYGYANSRTNDIVNFWSVGFQYQGLLEGRDDDVLGIGFAQGIFSNGASMTYNEDHENALEIYYDIPFAPWMNFSTGLQYIANPGGAKGVSDAVVFEMRTQMFL